MKTLLLDNYDSFSRILFQYLWEINGEEPLFVRNDEWTLERIRAERFDNIVISPGPGHPGNPRDFGVCGDLLRTDPGKPVLGVCLGLQGLGLAAGARVARAPEPRHGKPSRIRHDGRGVFAGLPQGFTAIRYHSLAIDPASVPAGLVVTAAAEDDGQIMGIRLEGRPAFGVQFHPESIGTAHGKALLANFRELTRETIRTSTAGSGPLPPHRPIWSPAPDALSSGGREVASPSTAGGSVPLPPAGPGRSRVPDAPEAFRSGRHETDSGAPPASPGVPPRVLEARALPWRDPESAFARWFLGEPASFWLDSLSEPVPGEPRMTYMGAGPVLYEAAEGNCRIRPAGGDGSEESRAGDPFAFLGGVLGSGVPCMLPEHLGFPGAFRGGLVGWFGYGLKRWSEGAPSGSGGGAASDGLPDALFLRPDRMLAFDPATQRAWAFLPCGPEGPSADARDWLERVAGGWDFPDLPPLSLERDSEATSPRPGSLDGFRLDWRPSASRDAYLETIEGLREAILRGETYEACLTNELRARCDADPFAVYRILRRTNPAPYAAFLRFPGHDVLCASPERFLKLDAGGRLECRPIKGTRPRGAGAAEDEARRKELAEAPKDRSENLMIVDLVRNDFGKVCALGSVEAPDLMRVEPHPSVWQLVSTVTGRLAHGRGPLDAVRACFPGGSMTGAPKRRTMELLEDAEKRPRGVFSGALGYLGWDGAMDLGMVIRTLVRIGDGYRIGCGGAILAESDPESEWAEALLKASAPMLALELAVFGTAGNWKSRSRIG